MPGTRWAYPRFTERTLARSVEDRQPATNTGTNRGHPARDAEPAKDTASSTRTDADPTSSPASAKPSSDADQQQIAKLKAIDAEVRAHESAHLAAAGSLAASGASFQYVKGPDGKLYAVGGEVQISMTGGNTPEETLSRAQQVRAAALAPANPSSQDMAVAARAASLESQARQELTTRNIARFQAHSPQSDANGARMNSPAPDRFDALA